jgi:YHS domain-containing protein
MNPQLRRAAKVCLLSTVTGTMLVPGHMLLAQTAARITHADAEEAAGPEPAPLNTLGPARPMPLRGEGSASAAQKHAAPSRGRRTAKSKLKSAMSRPAAGRPTSVPSGSSAENIRQAAAQVRPSPYANPYAPQTPAQAQAFAAQQAAPQSAPMSPIERELQELYRKNGRQMPDMNMQEYATPATQAAPAQAPAHPYSSRGAPAPLHRPAGRASKPNFFERIFGFGRARHKAAPAPRNAAPSTYGQPPGQGYASPGQRPAPQTSGYPPAGQAAPAPASPDPAPQLTPFRPNGQFANPPSAQQQPTYPAMREPAPLAPVDEAPPPARQPAATTLPAREMQPLIDESKLQNDSESLELAPEDSTGTKNQGPQILPNKTAERVSESPYTGLTINPHESEDGIARTEELEKALDKKPTESPLSSEAPTSASPQASGSAEDSALKHPLGGTPSAEPTAKKPASLDDEDDDELLDLDDEDDDDAMDARPAKSAADESMSIPGEEEPVFPRATGAEQSRTTPSEKTPAEKEKEALAQKLASAGTLKGFKGFCPVLLKDERRLVEAHAQFMSRHKGKIYTFSSSDAKQAFDSNPGNYAPAGGGKDVVRLAGGDNTSEGSLEHAAWYRGKLFLFSSAQTRREFIEAPSRFNVND